MCMNEWLNFSEPHNGAEIRIWLCLFQIYFQSESSQTLSKQLVEAKLNLHFSATLGVQLSLNNNLYPLVCCYMILTKNVPCL